MDVPRRAVLAGLGAVGLAALGRSPKRHRHSVSVSPHVVNGGVTVGHQDVHITGSTGGTLTAWQTALAARATTPAKVLILGDSIAEGQGSTTKANRWQDLLLAALRTNYPTTGGDTGGGILPVSYAVYGTSNTWGVANAASKTGTWTDRSDMGLGGRGGRLSSVGATFVWTVTGSSCDIWWRGGNGTFSWKVDAGSATNVNTASASGQANKTTISLGSAGSHTVTITHVSGTQSEIGFIDPHTASIGVQMFDHCHTGAYTDTFTGTQMNTDLLPAVAPDLVIWELLTANNFLNNHASAATNATQAAAQLAELNALPKKPTILPVIPWGWGTPAGITGGVNGGGQTYAQYLSALAPVLTGANVLTPVNLSTEWGVATTSGLWDSDGIHESDSGHTRIAGRVMTALNAFPDAGSTGVPAGTTLTAVPGSATSGTGWTWNGVQVVPTGNGVTITGLDITSSIDASARTGVTIENCLVRGVGETSFLVALGGGSSIVQDCELGGGTDGVTYTITSNQSPIGVYSGGSSARSNTILRCNIHHVQDAIRGDGGTYCKDTFIHHLNNGYGVADPFQFHTDGCQQTQGSGLMEFDHNSIETGNNDCIFIEIGTSAWSITDNYFTGRTGPGGSASFAIGGKTSETAHGTITITDNVFDTANCGQPAGNWPSGQTIVDGKGNVDLAGAAVTL